MEILLFLIYSGVLLLRGVAHGFETGDVKPVYEPVDEPVYNLVDKPVYGPVDEPVYEPVNVECSSSVVSEGDTAIFHVENLTCEENEGDFSFLGPRVYEYLRVYCSTNQIDYSSMTCYTRNGSHVCTSNANVSIKLQSENYGGDRRYNLSITISSTTAAKTGTYKLEKESWRFYRDYVKCWNLYVLSLKTTPLGPLTEHAAVFIHPYPQLQFWKYAKAEWLFDGQSVKQRAEMVEPHQILWIPNLGRQLNGKYVTYRVETSDGLMKEAMLMLDVIYGPDWPLVLEPDRSHYVLRSGEIMPDVTCATSCNPPCHVSWEQHSSHHVLHLGKVTETMTGEYTCRAKGHNSTVARSIFLYVKDDTDFRIIVTIGSAQAITMLFLIVCGVRCCVRTKRVRCAGFVTSVRSYSTGNFSRRTVTENGNETTEERDVQAIEIQEADTYEALDARTRCSSPTMEVFSNAQTENMDNTEVYETSSL